MPTPLRIALVIETGGGGSGRHFLDLAGGLADREHVVTAIWSPVRAEESFASRLRALPGVRSLELTMQRSIGLSDLSGLCGLSAMIRSGGPFDVLHAHSSKAGALVRMLPPWLPGARLYTPHAFRTMDPDLEPWARRVYGFLEYALSRQPQRIIAVSAAERDHALALGIRPDRLRVVLNGASLPVGADRTHARREMGVSDDEVVVGFVGRLTDQKDPLRFVRAVAHASASVSAIRGVVIGDGPLRQAAEAAASAAALRFLGWRDAPMLVPGLDVFAMTSRYEAMPYTLIEALHAGLPIVATAVGGTKETVQDGVNGQRLPVDASAEAIGAALARLAGDPALRARQADASKQMRRSWTVDAMIDATLAVYEEVAPVAASVSHLSSRHPAANDLDLP